MTGRTLILLIVAVIILAGAAIMVKNHSGGGAQSGPMILVATSNIAAGSFVRSEKDLAWKDWPGDISPSFIRDDTHKIEDFNGAVARRQILPGEPITTASIVRANDGGFLSAVLTPGQRAVSIAVNSTSGNAGFVFPGDKIDLILTHHLPSSDNSGPQKLASETFIQDVRVLAIDQMLDNPENKAVVAKTITLEVSPKQAEMINVAQSLGSISVSLRSLSAATKTADKPAGGLVGAGPNPLDVNVIHAPAGDYSTDDDVSKLMGDRSPVHSKVSVYHGSTSEQIDFNPRQK